MTAIPPPLPAAKKRQRLRSLLQRCERRPDARVVFDLDGTLLDTRQRNRAILDTLADVEALAGPSGSVPRLRERLETAGRQAARPYLSRYLRDLGFGEEEITAIRTLWRDHFFSDAYLEHDEPIAGAVDYVRAIHDAGATVVYFTGRDRQRMLSGTVTSLRECGFPIAEPRVELVMKPSPERSDWDYKREAAEHLEGAGKVLAAFDNEPTHCNVLTGRFVSAEVYLLTTGHLPGAPPPEPDVLPIDDFDLSGD